MRKKSAVVLVPSNENRIIASDLDPETIVKAKQRRDNLGSELRIRRE